MLEKKEKLRNINKALNSDPVDINTLRKLAITEGGLISDDIRRKVWPKLLNVNPFDYPYIQYEIKNHKDYNQVVLDVNRSMRRFPPAMSKEERDVLQKQLTEVILWVLSRNPELNYYQGYHDICVTFLLICGKKSSQLMLEQLSVHHLRDFMDPTMNSTRHILNYLNPIIKKENMELGEFMDRAEVGTIFALSWLITWYGHVLSQPKHVRRLYDLFLASHPLLPIYLAASIVLYRAEEVLHGECEMPRIHHLLSNIPADLPLENTIQTAVKLFENYPPESLAKEAALFYDKSLSVLRFRDFELAARNQRPDFILVAKKSEQSNLTNNHKNLKNQKKSTLREQGVKWTVWAISGAIGAAAIAITNMAVEWAPELLSNLT